MQLHSPPVEDRLHTLEKGVFATWDHPDVVVRDARRPAQPATPRNRFFEHLLQSGVREVIVIGVAADYCVRWTVEGLLARGFRVTVPAEMIRGITRQIAAVAEDEWAGKDVSIA